jgi:hypothetical protein
LRPSKPRSLWVDPIPGYPKENINVATARRTQTAEEAAAEIEIQEPETKIVIPAEMDPATSQVTRPSDLGFGKAREVEVEPLRELPPQDVVNGFMEVRMSETIEEFTYGNPHFMVRLEEGKRYRLPAHVGQYLIGLGKVYQRS